MTQSAPPDRASFLDAPDAEVAASAPATVVYAAGGTRRVAATEGISLDEAYIEYTRARLVENLDLFFRLGVRNVIVPCLGPRQIFEAAPYGENIIEWCIEALSGATMRAEYHRRGWRARLIVPSPHRGLQEAAALLQQEFTDATMPTAWYYLVVDDTDPWTQLFATVQRTGARSYGDALRALYGEEVPAAQMYIGFGKLVTGTTLVPPLLCAPNMQCYWVQRAGVRILEPMVRKIFYDYAFTRHTWRPDRRFRYQQTPEQQALWDTTEIIGVGSSKNGFWYPEPFGGAQE